MYKRSCSLGVVGGSDVWLVTPSMTCPKKGQGTEKTQNSHALFLTKLDRSLVPPNALPMIPEIPVYGT